MPIRSAPTAQPRPMMRPLWVFGVGEGTGKTSLPLVRGDELSRAVEGAN